MRKAHQATVQFCEGTDLFDLEQEYILSAYHFYKGNLTNTAKGLGLPRSTLYRRLRAFGYDTTKEFRLRAGRLRVGAGGAAANEQGESPTPPTL